MLHNLFKSCALFIATALITSNAFASDSVNNKYFTLDIPDDWRKVQRANTSSDTINVTLINKKIGSMVFIVIDGNVNPELKSIVDNTVNNLTTQIEAKDIVLKDREDGSYEVDAIVNGVPTRYYFATNSKDLSSIVIAAQDPNASIDLLKNIKPTVGNEKLFPTF